MNNYNEIISKLKNDDKIKLVSQTSFDKILLENTNVETLSFVQDKTLDLYMSSLNDTFFKGVYSNIYNDDSSIYLVSLSSINCDSIYLKKHFVSLYIDTLNKRNYKTCLEIKEISDQSNLEFELISELEIIKNTNPDFVLLKNFISHELINSYTKCESNFIIESENVTDIVNAINDGYKYIITSLDIQKELVSFIDKEDELKIDSNKLDEMLRYRLQNIEVEQKIESSFKDYSKNYTNELSIIYKNDNILPLDKKREVVLIGSHAVSDLFNVLNEANKYDINVKYFIHGYTIDSNIDNNYLIEDAINKTLNNIALVYVCPKDGLVSENEYNLVKALHDNFRDIIVVSLGSIDLRLLELANALISVPNISDFGKNTFDIINGLMPASAKTLTNLKLDDKILVNKYCGISLGAYTISDIKINDNYIEFIVLNQSNCIIEPTIFLTFNDNIIGFVKCLLDKGEFKTLSIKLNVDSFKEYNNVLKEYELKNSKVEALLTDFDKLNEEIEMDFGTEEEVTINSKCEYKNHLKLKFFITILVSIYLIAMLVIIALNNSKELVTTIVMYSLVGAIGLFDIIYLIVFIIRSKKRRKTLVEDDTIDFNKFGTFSKENDLIYKAPVTMEKDVVLSPLTQENVEINIDNTNSETENAEEIMNPVVDSEEYDLFEESTSLNDLSKEREEFERIESAKDVDLSLIVKDFSSYLLSKGLTVSLKSIKTLFASFATSKFIVLKSNDLFLENAFVMHLSEFLKNKFFTLDLSNYNSFKELSEDNNDLIQFIDLSNQNADNVSLIYVKGDTKNFTKVLKPFIRQNENNTNVSVLLDSKKVMLPKNAYFIISGENFNEYSDLTFELTLDIAQINPETYEKELSPLSVSSIYNLVKNNADKNFIPEDEFKKFDNMYDAFNSSLSNRTTLDFEKIFVLLSILDIDQKDSIDILFRGRIAPMLKNSNLYKINKAEVINIISKIFDSKEYPLTLTYLSNSSEVSHE